MTKRKAPPGTEKKTPSPQAPATPKPSPAPAAPPRKRFAALSTERTHRLRRDQLLRYRTLEAEARAAEANFRMAEMVFATLINNRPEVVQAQAQRKAAQETFRAARVEYLAYMEELGTSLGVDMKRVGIDESTGLVRELPLEGNEAEEK